MEEIKLIKLLKSGDYYIWNEQYYISIDTEDALNIINETECNVEEISENKELYDNIIKNFTKSAEQKTLDQISGEEKPYKKINVLTQDIINKLKEEEPSQEAIKIEKVKNNKFHKITIFPIPIVNQTMTLNIGDENAAEYIYLRYRYCTKSCKLISEISASFFTRGYFGRPLSELLNMKQVDTDTDIEEEQEEILNDNMNNVIIRIAVTNSSRIESYKYEQNLPNLERLEYVMYDHLTTKCTIIDKNKFDMLTTLSKELDQRGINRV
jgi:hypothetical protein